MVIYCNYFLCKLKFNFFEQFSCDKCIDRSAHTTMKCSSCGSVVSKKNLKPVMNADQSEFLREMTIRKNMSKM